MYSLSSQSHVSIAIKFQAVSSVSLMFTTFLYNIDLHRMAVQEA